MQISSVSSVGYYSPNNSQYIVQLQKQIETLQKQIELENESKADAATDKQKKILLFEQQIQQLQAQIQQLSNSSAKGV